jgi:predicted O-methyltransferase YrrM
MRLRHFAKSVLRGASAPALKHVDVRKWPAVLGRIHDVQVPRNIIAQQLAPCGPANINIILSLLDRAADIPGAVAECGVWRGATLVTMALYLAKRNRGKKVYGFDSFEGFPKAELAQERALHASGTDSSKNELGFTDTALSTVQKKLDFFGLDNVRLVKGFFNETLMFFPSESYSFVHLDCDLYGSYMQCLEYFYPRVVPGGIILLDEYNDPPWPGCNKAVDEFLNDKYEKLDEIERDGFQKYYFVKA